MTWGQGSRAVIELTEDPSQLPVTFQAKVTSELSGWFNLMNKSKLQC